MKKNAMLKIAAVLLVAVLLTTCAISSTFSKYKSSQAIEVDNARVAKWGVTINSIANADNLFVADYTDVDGGTTEVVAPGTHGELTVTGLVSGTPEVDGEYVYYVKVEKTGFDAHDPVTVKVGSNVIGNTWTEVADGEFDAGTSISDATSFKIEWAWAFDDGTPDDPGVIDALDQKDTALGTAGTAPTIKVSVLVDVVQTSTTD